MFQIKYVICLELVCLQSYTLAFLDAGKHSACDVIEREHELVGLGKYSILS